MTRVLRPAIAGLLALIAANNVFAQTTPAPRVRLQVVLDRFEGETKTGSAPFFFSLLLEEKGTLRVEAEPAKAKLGEPCATLVAAGVVTGAPVGAPMPVQFVGTQVESTVLPVEDGNFSVSLQFTERTLAGCTQVQNLWIPIFSNRIVAHTIRVRNDEPGEILLKGDAARNESTKVTVTLKTGN